MSKSIFYTDVSNIEENEQNVEEFEMLRARVGRYLWALEQRKFNIKQKIRQMYFRVKGVKV